MFRRNIHTRAIEPEAVRFDVALLLPSVGVTITPWITTPPLNFTLFGCSITTTPSTIGGASTKYGLCVWLRRRRPPSDTWRCGAA